MDGTNNIATDLFFKVRSRFANLKLGDDTGSITINPESARFFDFDYTEGDKRLGHVSISLAEPNSMKVYFSNGISEGMDDSQKEGWYGFLRELRKFAKRRLIAYDTRDIAKDNLDKRDYAFLSQYATPASQDDTITKPVGENIMSESSLYGTKTQSFQKLMDTKLIIKHSKTLADDHEQKPGDRSRNIAALFVQNEQGERFKYPFIHLAGARAMQRHVANGGLPYDDIGESIIQMSEEIAQLKSFTNYVVRNDLMNSDTNSIVERSTGQLDELRNRMAKLSKQSHYEAYIESFVKPQAVEVPDDVMEQYKEQFTVKNFKEDLTTAFPIIYKLMKEEETVGYDDIVKMTEAGEMDADALKAWYNKYDDEQSWDAYSLGNGFFKWKLDSGIATDAMERSEVQALIKKFGEEAVMDDPFAAMDKAPELAPITTAMHKEFSQIVGKKYPDEEDFEKASNLIQDIDEEAQDPFDSFESWVSNLGEASPINSGDDTEMAQAAKELNTLIGQEFPAGTDGTNAIQSLKGIIEDPRLDQDIKKAAQENPEVDVRPMIKAWCEENCTDVMNDLDFGDTSDEPAVGADDIEPQQEASGYEGQEEPHKHIIDIEGDYDQDRGIGEKECSAMEKELEAAGIKAACEPDESRQGAVVIHTMSDKNTVLSALEKSGYTAEGSVQEGGMSDVMIGVEELVSEYTKEGSLDSGLKMPKEEVIKAIKGSKADGIEVMYAIDMVNNDFDDNGNYTGDMGEGNEFAKKVQDLKAKGAKKGTKFTTSDGEEHTLEDVAQFIHSFYDRNTGTFPKGPEGVAIMVGKKFGEQAENVARKMVERMAPEQEQGAEEIERIKQLSGF